jgi:hypothetical protein
VTAAALKLRGSADIRIGVPDEAAAEDFVECTRSCAETNETCAEACPDGTLAAACGGDCLAAFSECSLACGLEHHDELHPAAFAYATPAMPAWPNVLLAFDPALDSMLQCSGSRSKLLVRGAWTGAASNRADIALLLRQGGSGDRECAQAALARVKLPEAEAPYAFAAVIDPSEDLLARAQRYARLDLAQARKRGDPRVAARAQQQVWELQARSEARARDARLAQERQAREEQKRQAELAAQQQWQYNAAYPYSPPRYRQPVESARPERPPPPRSDYDQSSSARAYSDYQRQAELQRMNERKQWEERRAEERKREEVERLDREAHMKELQKLGW